MTNLQSSPKKRKPYTPPRSLTLTPYGRWVAARQDLLKRIAGRPGWKVEDTEATS